MQKRKLQNKYYELSIKITHVVLYFMTLILLFYRVCCSEWWVEMWSWGQNGMWSCHRRQEAIHQTPRRDSSVYLCHKEWKGHPCPGRYYPRRRILSHNIFLWERYKSDIYRVQRVFLQASFTFLVFQNDLYLKSCSPWLLRNWFYKCILMIIFSEICYILCKTMLLQANPLDILWNH